MSDRNEVWVAENLWQSGNPEDWMPQALEEFDLIVLVSTEHQFAQYHHPAIYRAPISGSDKGTIDEVIHAATRVTRALDDGKKVLVTCSAGLNRSGAVAAIALRWARGMSPNDAIAAVRKACGESAIRKPNLLTFVRDAERTMDDTTDRHTHGSKS